MTTTTTTIVKQQWLALSELVLQAPVHSPQETLLMWQLDRIEKNIEYEVLLTWLDEAAKA